MKKALSILLAALLLASSMVACAEQEKASEETSPAAGEDDPAVETAAEEPEITRENHPDNLPEKDYAGRTFTLFTREHYEDKFQPEELTGEAVNDALFQRNSKVSDRYNIVMQYHSEPCDWGSTSTTWNNNLYASVMAADGAYDCVAGYASTVPEVITKNILLNWREVPYINLSEPWWSERASEALTVNGKQFLLTGDYSLALWDNMFGFLFNKKLVNEFGYEDLYETVRSHKWTLDKLTDLSASTTMDLDGNGTYDSSDLFGLASNYSTAIDSFQISAEMAIISHTANGSLEITLNSERAMSILEKVCNLYNDSKGAYADYGDETIFDTMFMSDRALFYPTYFARIETLRDMESDFGVLPYPLYDEAQEQYDNTSRDNFDLFVLPIDVKDVEFSGILTEALSAESWRSVIPQYYDVVLKVKNSRDEESAEMLDLIRDSLMFDYGYLCSTSLSGIGHIFVNLVRANSTDLASNVKSKEKPAQKALEQMLASYGIGE